MLTVTLYWKEDCHLCEQVEADLASLQSEYPHRLVKIDIKDDEELLRKYGLDIPVIEVGPYTLKAPIDKKRLMVALGAASDRRKQKMAIEGEVYTQKVERGQQITWGDKLTYWFSHRYMLIFNILVAIYVGLPFLAPVLAKNGINTPATIIYKVYGGLCHQLAFRSVFLFGEQPFYPREVAGVNGLETFGAATGIDENDIIAARKFIGNEKVGYKVALCQRDVAIYGGILLFGLLFSLTGRRLKSLPLFLWILIGIFPIGLDGVSQLVSQMSFGLVPFRESTPFLRFLTGFLFGFTTAWFGYPLVEETMADARQLLKKKFAVVAAIQKE